MLHPDPTILWNSERASNFVSRESDNDFIRNFVIGTFQFLMRWKYLLFYETFKVNGIL